MNNITMLTSALEREPGNSILSAMLTDALMEERDMNRSEADRHVTSIVAVASEAAQLSDAAALLALKSPIRYQIQNRILALSRMRSGGELTIVLVPGTHPPTVVADRHIDAGGLFWWNTVTVGAANVLSYAAEITPQRSRSRRA